MIHDNAASALLPLFNCGKLFLILDRLCYETSSICLDKHQLQDVNLLVSHPGVVELLQVATHVFQHVLHGDVHFLHDALVDISDDLLDHFELLKQFSSGFQHILRENILFAVDPEVGESFLSGIEDFCEIA